MARDWVDLVFDIEAAYKRASGGVAQDEQLRLRLVGWANNLFKEVERTRRWPFAYGGANIVTVPGQESYPIPAGILSISNVYWLDAGGNPSLVENYTAMQMRQAFGEGPGSQQGPPVKFSILGNFLEIFPIPDASGPTAGNYTLVIEGYQSLQPIVETSGTTLAANAALTVPSGAYLTARGIATSGTTGLSVRAAGNLGVSSAPDTHITNWSAIVGNVVTMTTPAVTAIGLLSAQVFFNSVNWLITDFPKVVEFGVLREVASYLKDDYGVWDQRYQLELQLMAEFAVDRQQGLEQMATVTLGQRVNQLRRLDVLLGVEVRGGVI